MSDRDDIAHAMTLEGVRWRCENFWNTEGQTTRDFDFLLTELAKRDAELKAIYDCDKCDLCEDH